MSGLRTDAIIFDFDGVLVESTDIKTEAFATVYRRHGAHIAEQAVAYHLAHAGISRFVKFRHLHQNLLGIELTDAQLRELGAEFSALVADAIVSLPWVRGAREFIDAHFRTLPLFVASGTPDEELKAIIERRGMQCYFRSVHGTPATKGEIIQAIVDRHGFEPERVLMVGDAAADFEGAESAGTRFLGRVQGVSPFPPGVDTLPDLRRLTQFL